jgi:hypothetical protein
MTTMSCDDETANEPVNPFVGTWEDENNLSGGVRYVFTETKVSQYSTNRVNQIEPLLIFAGVYTYNDTHITIITDYRHEEIQNLEIYPNPFVWIYSFEGDILKIAFGIVKKIN